MSEKKEAINIRVSRETKADYQKTLKNSGYKANKFVEVLLELYKQNQKKTLI
jgi:hypothetical protein